MNNKIDQQLNQINRLYKESSDIYSIAASQLKLTDTAFWILYAVLHTDKEYTQMDFANEWFYPIQTVNSAVNQLVKKELVMLEVIPGTKNRKKIILTEKGNALVNSTICKIDEIEKTAFLTLTQEEREVYLSLMQRHIDILKKEMNNAFAPKIN